MSATPQQRLELMERIEGSTPEQLSGWGMGRCEAVFLALAQERAAVEDAWRLRHPDGTVEEADPKSLAGETARVDAAEAKIIAAITRGAGNP